MRYAFVAGSDAGELAWRTVLPIAALALVACDGNMVPARELPSLAAPVLTDQNPDPNIVEVVLVAGTGETEFLPGKRADVWAYRDGSIAGAKGTVPGPTLEVKPGNRVIVHFRNELPADMTVHWHGLRLPNASDGTPSSQTPVGSGQTYRYEFDAIDEGTFWYHPHLQADVFIERGLYGALRVQGDTMPPVAADRIFVVDDVKLEAEGGLSATTVPLDIMLGRQGNFLLINGKSEARMAVQAGTRERWRFINSANGRYFNLRLADDRPFLVVAWDGGPLPRPYQANRVLVAPGERYEIVVSFLPADVDKPLSLQTVHYDRGHNIPDPGPLDLLKLTVTPPSSAEPLPDMPLAWAEWQPLPVTASTPARVFRLKEVEKDRDVEFFINDHAFPHHTPITGVQDDLEIWEVRNETEMDHPFHLHGMFFQVLDVNGVPPQYRGIKDTVNVPHKATLRFAVRLGPPGSWMFHCHILEHAERGMMGELKITVR